MAEHATIPELEGNTLDLAAPVIGRVQILNVILVESRTKRAPKVDGDQEKLRSEITIANVEFGMDEEAKLIFVLPSFVLKMTYEQEGSEGEPSLLIEAKFVLIYSVDSFDGLEVQNIAAFGVTNGVHNAWPYWREFVQNTGVRMGIAPITLPVYRM